MERDLKKIVSQMTLEEKVGQVFMVWFAGPTVSDDIAGLIRQRHLGGVILYSVPGNIESPGQLAALNAGLQAVSAATVVFVVLELFRDSYFHRLLVFSVCNLINILFPGNTKPRFFLRVRDNRPLPPGPPPSRPPSDGRGTLRSRPR